jgi:hypothetical protein
MLKAEALTQFKVILWHFSGKTQQHHRKRQSEQLEHPVKAIHKYSWFSEFALSHSEHKHNWLKDWNGILKFMEHNTPSCWDTNNFVHRK